MKNKLITEKIEEIVLTRNVENCEHCLLIIELADKLNEIINWINQQDEK